MKNGISASARMRLRVLCSIAYRLVLGWANSWVFEMRNGISALVRMPVAWNLPQISQITRITQILAQMGCLRHGSLPQISRISQIGICFQHICEIGHTEEAQREFLGYLLIGLQITRISQIWHRWGCWWHFTSVDFRDYCRIFVRFEGLIYFYLLLG